MSRMIAIVILVTVFGSYATAVELYDDSRRIDPAKWSNFGTVSASAQTGRLLLSNTLRDQSNSDTGTVRNEGGIIFADPANIVFIQAEVTPAVMLPKGCVTNSAAGFSTVRITQSGSGLYF